jgi:hypothetical protein
LSIQLGGIDVSRVDLVPPLNVTKITQGPFPIVIQPGALSARKSEVMNLPLYFQANVAVPVLLQFKDDYGNHLVKSPTFKEIRVRMGGYNLPYQDNQNGTYTLMVGIKSAGSNFYLEVEIDSEHIKDSPTPYKLTVYPGPPHARGSDCIVPNHFVAGSLTDVQCKVNDLYGNSVSDQDLFLVSEARSLFLPIRTITATGTFNQVTGRYDLPMKLEQMGQYSLVSRLQAPGGLMAQYYRAPGFESMIARYTDRNHRAEVLTEYTQIDSQVNFVWPGMPTANA